MAAPPFKETAPNQAPSPLFLLGLMKMEAKEVMQ